MKFEMKRLFEIDAGIINIFDGKLGFSLFNFDLNVCFSSWLSGSEGRC